MLYVKPVIYSVVVFTLLCFAVKKRDSSVIFNITMLLCWCVIAMSMESYDITNYRSAYDFGLIRGKEPMFDFLQIIFSSLGIPFCVFKLLYSTVVWALLYRGLKNFTVEVALVATVFVLGPMMGYGTQMRSSMAGAIILNAIPFLLNEDKNWWKYCVLVITASLFHLMAVFYFIFLIPKCWKINAKKFRKYMYILAILLIPLLLLVRTPVFRFLTLLQTWSNISIFGRMAQYFSGNMSPNIKGFLYTAGGHFVVFFITDRMCIAMQTLGVNTEQGRRRTWMSNYAVEYLRKLNSILLLMIPCYILCLQFDRFNNYYLPICYCLIVQGTRELREKGAVQELALPPVKPRRVNKLFEWINRLNLLQTGKADILVLLTLLIFCFFVNNRFSENSEFVRILNGVGKFANP